MSIKSKSACNVLIQAVVYKHKRYLGADNKIAKGHLQYEVKITKP